MVNYNIPFIQSNSYSLKKRKKEQKRVLPHVDYTFAREEDIVNNTDPTTMFWNDYNLAQDVMIEICSFCDLTDILSLRCVSAGLRRSTHNEMKQRTNLSFSALVGYYHYQRGINSKPSSLSSVVVDKMTMDYNDNKISNLLKKSKQNDCVNTLLHELFRKQSEEQNDICCWQRMDFCNLRYLSSLSSLTPQHFQRLVSLDLSFCSRIEPVSLMACLDERYLEPSLLQELYLNGCRKFKGVHINRLVKFFTGIKVLHLAGCSQTIDDKCVECICDNLPLLQSLDLMGFDRVTDRSSIEIFAKLNQLEYLNVNNCVRLRWHFILPYLQQLSRLIENSSAEEIISLCKSSIRNENLSFLRDFFSCRLKVANVSFGPSTRGGLFPYGLAALAITSFGALKEVNVSGSNIIDNDVKILVMTCDALKSLEMRCCDNIGDESLNQISIYCQSLANLDISACFNVTDIGMRQLQYCICLSSLKASALAHLTDESIFYLTSLKKLLVLDLHDCQNVTQKSIECLLDELPLLVEVDARNISCPSIGVNVQKRHNLSIWNGKRIRKGSVDIFTCCSVRENSQRTSEYQGARPRRMYHCVQCQLLPKFNRGMCVACTTHCRNAHHLVFQGAVTIYYCDCAFGFQNVSGVL